MVKSSKPNNMIYLDYAATSPILPEAKKAMLDVLDNFPGNASALHTPGHRAHEIIETARADIARLIGAQPHEIIFTSGGSESNNTVTNIFAGQSVAVSAIEHASVLESARARCNCIEIPVNKYGEIKDSFFESIKRNSYENSAASEPCNDRCERASSRKNLSLISIMLANNELGTIQDIKHLAKLAHQYGALFHTDATQALGKIPINVKDLDVDYTTISAHKIGGPVGIGALYVKDGTPFTPLIIGGHQEHGKRAGTYATANIAGFGAAAKYAYKHNTPKLYAEKIAPLRDELASRILKEIPFSNINGSLSKRFSSRTLAPPAVAGALRFARARKRECPLEKHLDNLPNILNVSFEAAEGESIQLYLDAKADIAISTGSACAAGDGKPSHVIMATTNDAEVAHSSIRFSLGLDTTKQDIDEVMKILPDIINNLQQISTIKMKGAK
ncbi:cysteine desulfurase [Candidatus Saccharibacteria bacterium]|nr:cysteine desulfurase [Candidatus Saccharibacteria bacterium]